MIHLYLKLIMLVACLQAGIELTKGLDNLSRSQIRNIEKAQREVVSIKWKPISIFPEKKAH